ncbi:MAG: hypothetical protein BGO07_00110 [Alphaproteobacteria bacterium 40-19]|nr:MAG: hypothetical protein BGO07_00110 [Alphaproteobacteria bacterium 40-19]
MKFLKLLLLGSLFWSVESFSNLLQPHNSPLNSFQSSESDSSSFQSSESDLNLAKPNELTGFSVQISKIDDLSDRIDFADYSGHFVDESRYIRRDDYAANFFLKMQSVLTRNQFKKEVQSFCTEILNRITLELPEEHEEVPSFIESGIIVRKEEGELQVNKELFNQFVTCLVQQGIPLKEVDGGNRQYADFICPSSGVEYVISNNSFIVEGMVSYAMSKKSKLSEEDAEKKSIY